MAKKALDVYRDSPRSVKSGASISVPGAAAVLLVWILAQFGVEMPADVAIAIVVLAIFAVQRLLSRL